jgi:hypothetical protein
VGLKTSQVNHCQLGRTGNTTFKRIIQLAVCYLFTKVWLPLRLLNNFSTPSFSEVWKLYRYVSSSPAYNAHSLVCKRKQIIIKSLGLQTINMLTKIITFSILSHFFVADCVNSRTPIYIDGWMNSQSFACLLCESPFSLDSTWKVIWEQDVVLIVTLLTSAAKVTSVCSYFTIKFSSVNLPLSTQTNIIEYIFSNNLPICSGHFLCDPEFNKT